MSDHIIVFETNRIPFEVNRWYRMAQGTGWFRLPDGEPEIAGDQLIYDEEVAARFNQYGKEKAMFAIMEGDIEKTFAMGSVKDRILYTKVA